MVVRTLEQRQSSGRRRLFISKPTPTNERRLCFQTAVATRAYVVLSGISRRFLQLLKHILVINMKKSSACVVPGFCRNFFPFSFNR